ncbi:MAG TPA: transketolase [Candidatus Omnitrophota bacterium]|nr:transketolase [Candidatus Omnitrophota bacterium]HRY85589.1 transketolase [Candidatus Omnitrophota bacterium]
MAKADTKKLQSIAAELRGKIIETSCKAKVPHLGSCLSCVDILTALYWHILDIDPQNPAAETRDRFLLSKGHAAPALFQVLAMRGFFPSSELENYGKDGSLFAEHPPAHGVPGIEAATGSLGHGLSIAVGLALSSRIKHIPNKTVALMSDGECNEGSVWEAAMFAASQATGRLIAIIDYNKWQATGRSQKIMALDPFREKWKAFGWSAYETDGHDIAKLIKVLSKLPDGSGKPAAVICHTVKGKGVSFMEDNNDWHYRIPKPEEVEAAKKELGLIKP